MATKTGHMVPAGTELMIQADSNQSMRLWMEKLQRASEPRSGGVGEVAEAHSLVSLFCHTFVVCYVTQSTVRPPRVH